MTTVGSFCFKVWFMRSSGSFLMSSLKWLILCLDIGVRDTHLDDGFARAPPRLFGPKHPALAGLGSQIPFDHDRAHHTQPSPHYLR